MTCVPITSWQTDGEPKEKVTDFIFLGSKITADCDCRREIKRCLFLGIKAMTNLDSILQSRDITLPTKVHLVKAMVFLVVKYGCESWTIKKAECQRIGAFKLCCWRKLLICQINTGKFYYQRNENQNYNEVSPCTGQNGHHQKVYKQ